MSRYRDNYAQFNANQAAVFGVSVDSTWANLAFRQQMKLDFPLLSDSKKDYTRALGILDENSGMARRVTFVIDDAGILRHIDLGAGRAWIRRPRSGRARCSRRSRGSSHEEPQPRQARSQGFNLGFAAFSIPDSWPLV